MKPYTLHRTEALDDGTFGFIMDEDGIELCKTCELPWRQNVPKESCIPTGSYICLPYNSPHHPDVWQVTDVPSRSAILIHNGNTEIDSLGCIIVGLTRGKLNGMDAVLQSNKAIEKLRTIWTNPFRLEIIEHLT